jgi:hypothetical protein
MLKVLVKKFKNAKAIRKLSLNKKRHSRLGPSFAVFLVIIGVILSTFAPKVKAAIALDANLTSTPASSNPTATSLSTNTTAAAASGSKIIAVVSWYHATATASLSGGSLTWHQDITTNMTVDTSMRVAIFSADAPSGLSSGTTLTATFSAGSDGKALAAMSFTGVATGISYDGTSTNPATTAPAWDSGAISTANANDLIVGFGAQQGIGNSTATPNTNYTEAHDWTDAGANEGWESVYRIVSSTASYTAGGTFSNGGNAGVGGVSVAYKATAPNTAPSAPSLVFPSNGASSISVTPQFQLRTTDANSDYLQYEIQVCSTNNCSSVVRTVCQNSSLPNSCTGSQTGWSGQDQQSSTAYTGSSTIGSSTLAAYTYQLPPLSLSTQYWWRAYAIDPGGSNTASGASSIFSFTTVSNSTPATPTLVSPAVSETNVSSTPLLQLRTTDSDSDYLQYFIQLYSATACGGSLVGTFDQTSSQTNWQGQDSASSTAYVGSSTLSSSTIARYQYSGTALTPKPFIFMARKSY